MALKSKLSIYLTAGKRAYLMRRSTGRLSREFEPGGKAEREMARLYDYVRTYPYSTVEGLSHDHTGKLTASSA